MTTGLMIALSMAYVALMVSALIEGKTCLATYWIGATILNTAVLFMNK